ncbi:hypothetical protein FOCC_FOCC000419 [Frankliniella occidentalis]|nr:hypothetical protein FOCC_FOCC000419 [Frankliniella occidentalis]
MAPRRAGRETAGNAHLHGLRYFPAKGLSTFDILDTILIEESHSRLQSKQLDSSTRPGLSVKINTWTSDNIHVTSNSVQATVSTANAVCQRTRISSPEDASEENLPKPHLCETDQNLVENSKLFEKRTTPIKIETNKAQGSSTVCVEKHSYPNNFCIDTIDMSSEYIPRSHNDTIETENSVRSRHSPILLPSTSFTKTKSKHEMSTITTHHGISATSMSQAKLTGPQRAQKRIACFLGDDIPGTILAVLTEVLPIFLERTRSELLTPRQNLIQKLLYEDYFNHPANTSDGLNAREDPQALLRVGTMAHQVALLVEDTARSTELDMQADRRPP